MDWVHKVDVGRKDLRTIMAETSSGCSHSIGEKKKYYCRVRFLAGDKSNGVKRRKDVACPRGAQEACVELFAARLLSKPAVLDPSRHKS